MELPSGNAAEAAQRFLDEAFKDAKTAADTYGKRASRRRMLAYGLKGIAAGSSLQLYKATPLSWEWLFPQLCW